MPLMTLFFLDVVSENDEVFYAQEGNDDKANCVHLSLIGFDLVYTDGINQNVRKR